MISAIRLAKDQHGLCGRDWHTTMIGWVTQRVKEGGFSYGLKQGKDFVDHGLLSVPHSSGVAQWLDPGGRLGLDCSSQKAGIED